MRLLLDTHALLWWFTDDRQLSTKARSAIADLGNDVLVSAASAWEIATKQRLGKLNEVPQAAERFSELVAADGFGQLPISYPSATSMPCVRVVIALRIAIPLIACWPPRASWSRSSW